MLENLTPYPPLDEPVNGPLLPDINSDGAPDISMAISVNDAQVFSASFVADEEFDLSVTPRKPLFDAQTGDRTYTIRAGNSYTQTIPDSAYYTRKLRLPSPATQVATPADLTPVDGPFVSPPVRHQLLHIYGLDTEPYTVLEDPAGGEYRIWGREKRLVEVPEEWTVLATPENERVLAPAMIQLGKEWLQNLADAREEPEKVAAAPVTELREPDFTSVFRTVLHQRRLSNQFLLGNPGLFTVSFPCGGPHEQGRSVDVNSAEFAVTAQEQYLSTQEWAQHLPSGLTWFGSKDRVHYGMDPPERTRHPDQEFIDRTNQAQLDYRLYEHLAGIPLRSTNGGNPWAPIIHCRFSPNNPSGRLPPQ
ncbi:MAG: hypothetical protein KDH09_16545 [Chrysiogenetes bacterium]|nr:hypothetical protein [Chrysiogenetes bacterium]